MKLRHVFSVVIGAHLAVIALLFVTPGCQSGSGGDAPSSADTAPSAGYTRDWQTGPVHTPSPTPSTDGTLYSPTRPDWNVNEATSAAVVVSGAGNDESIEILQPVRSGNRNATDASSFGELIPVNTGSGSVADSSATAGGSSYKVQAGDNLTKIARQHGVSVNALMSANGLTRQSANRIRVGQELTIPAGGTAATGSAAGSQGSAAVSGEVYEVVSGDTLGGIAARHGVSVSALRSANNISGDRILVGQKLRLPNGAAAQSGSSSRSGSSAAAPQGSGSESVGGQYTVRSGDTLGGIAARHGTTVQAILQANGMDDPHRLRVDQKLTIPGRSGSSATTSSTPAPRSGTSASGATGAGSATGITSQPLTTAPLTRAPEPAPVLPSSPGSFGDFGSFGSGSQGSGDDLLNDLDNIPTVPAQ